MANFNFECPHCGRAQTVTAKEESSGDIFFETSDTAFGKIGIWAGSVCCANPECRKPTVFVSVKNWSYSSHGRVWLEGAELVSKRLIPESSARPQPECIPLALRNDYIEACRIVELSPKAAATLARRCLQGMIRDFCGIQKGTLNDEIRELKKLVDEDKAPKGVSDNSVEAIDAVRKIGNIGAHMEKDINLIIDVDPDEAQTLIELIETLFEDWYVARDTREKRFAKLSAIAEAKADQKKIGVAKLAQLNAPSEADNEE